MKESLTSSTARMALTMMGGCALIIFSAVAAYVFYLGPISDYKISSTDTTAWANFATYFGGVLGPIFGFLAFMGVLFTLVLQARQMDFAHKQAGLEEFQRNLSSCAAALDAILGRRIGKRLPHQGLDGVLSVKEVIAWEGNTARLKTSDEVSFKRSLLINLSSRATLREHAPDLHDELDHLVWCLTAYENEGGREEVVELYNRRYRHLVNYLNDMGLVEARGEVERYFKLGKTTLFSSNCGETTDPQDSPY